MTEDYFITKPPPLLRGRSRSLDPPQQKRFSKSDFAVVSSGKPNRLSDNFRTSLGEFMDGAEFMMGGHQFALVSQSSLDNDPDEERDKAGDSMELAISKGMKMAQLAERSNVNEDGDYVPFDASDPTTWDRKKAKQPMNESNSPQRRKEYVSRERSHSRRRNTAPMVSSYVLEQQEKAEQQGKIKHPEPLHRAKHHRRGSSDPEVVDSAMTQTDIRWEEDQERSLQKKSGHRSRRRSTAPMVSPYVLDQQENKERKREKEKHLKMLEIQHELEDRAWARQPSSRSVPNASRDKKEGRHHRRQVYQQESSRF
jgi:hypothetical protein